MLRDQESHSFRKSLDPGIIADGHIMTLQIEHYIRLVYRLPFQAVASRELQQLEQAGRGRGIPFFVFYICIYRHIHGSDMLRLLRKFII